MSQLAEELELASSDMRGADLATREATDSAKRTLSAMRETPARGLFQRVESAVLADARRAGKKVVVKITGADEPGRHVVGLVAGRDFVPDGTIEAAEVRDGDPSPDGAGPLVSARGIEIGHIFQLGRKYTDAFSVDVLGEDGKPVRLTMGSYGIGVSRLVAVIAEQQHDELGLRWPASVAPFDVHVVIANKDAEARAGAEALAADLDRLGHEVLLDDRTASPGVKFKDAELLGVPWIVVVGRGWADGTVELRNRLTGEKREIAAEEAAQAVAAAVG